MYTHTHIHRICTFSVLSMRDSEHQMMLTIETTFIEDICTHIERYSTLSCVTGITNVRIPIRRSAFNRNLYLYRCVALIHMHRTSYNVPSNCMIWNYRSLARPRAYSHIQTQHTKVYDFFFK